MVAIQLPYDIGNSIFIEWNANMDRDEIARKIGLNIRHFRKQRLLSQEKLALDAEIHPAYLGKLEQGNVPQY